MRIKSAFKYQMSEVKKPIIIYYIVVVSLLLLAFFGALWLRQWSGSTANVHVDNYGFGGASVIFLFILGLNAYKSTFHMLIANGVSRKTMFISFALMALSVSVGMMAADALISQISTHALNSFVHITTRFEYAGFGMGLLWMFCGNFAAIVIGYLIAVLYYRMNKPVKLLVSIGIPVFFLIILPIFDMYFFRGAVVNALLEAIRFLSGVSTNNPLIGIASALVLGGLAYLAIRRAPVKA